MEKLKQKLFQATQNAQDRMTRLHKECENVAETEKQFAVGQFSALYGFILENQLHEEYSDWVKNQ